MIVVCNSTILIGLAKIERLELLKQIFSKIYIPEEVYREVVERAENRPGAQIIREAEWIKTVSVKDKTQVDLLSGTLDRGEAEVLVLAKELGAELILLDEEKARKSALIGGFNVMGLLGMFTLAKNLGLINKVRPLIDELKRKKFRISDRLVSEILKRVGEEKESP